MGKYGKIVTTRDSPVSASGGTLGPAALSAALIIAWWVSGDAWPATRAGRPACHRADVAGAISMDGTAPYRGMQKSRLEWG